MKLTRAGLAICWSTALVACGIPVVIVGQGDVFSRTGEHDCAVANPSAAVTECYKEFMTVDDWVLVNKGLLTPEPIQETYYAIPARGYAVQSMVLSDNDVWSFDCRYTRSSECVFDLPSEAVKSFVTANTNPALTTTFGSRTSQLTINGVIPKKIHASDYPQRFIIKGEGFLVSDRVTLVDLSDADTLHSIIPIKVDEAAGLMVIEETFTVRPSRWLIRVTRNDDSETVAIPVDVIDAVDAMPLTDTFIVDGIEWVQPLSLHYLLYPLSRNEIKTACPQGICTGVIKGYDLSGWTWAKVADAKALIKHYLGESGSSTAPASLSQANSSWAPAILRDFESAAYDEGTGHKFSAIFGVLYNPTALFTDDRAGALQIIDSLPAGDPDVFSTAGSVSGACCNPPLLYRPLPIAQ